MRDDDGLDQVCGSRIGWMWLYILRYNLDLGYFCCWIRYWLREEEELRIF